MCKLRVKIRFFLLDFEFLVGRLVFGVVFVFGLLVLTCSHWKRTFNIGEIGREQNSKSQLLLGISHEYWVSVHGICMVFL